MQGVRLDNVHFPAEEILEVHLEGAEVDQRRPGAEGLASGEVFGPTRAAAEVNRRYAGRLSEPATFKLASAALRRLHANGVLRLVRRGSAHQESLYTKG